MRRCSGRNDDGENDAGHCSLLFTNFLQKDMLSAMRGRAPEKKLCANKAGAMRCALKELFIYAPAKAFVVKSFDYSAEHITVNNFTEICT